MATNDLLTHNFDNESDDEDDFNPAPADISDEEDGGEDDAPEDMQANELARRKMTEDDNSDDREDGDAAPARNGGSRTGSRGRDDDDDDDAEGEGEDLVEGHGDDDEEDEEDEEDEDEEEVTGHRRKRRRERRNQFLDVEAEVDDEDEEGEDEEDELNEIKDNFIADTHPDDLANLPAGELSDDEQHRELDRRREMENSMDAEKQAKILKERYARSRPLHSLGDTAVVPKRLLLPSVDDPSIWAVRCKEGKEREAVFSIMKRIEERSGTKDELAITAAFERGGPNAPMRGHVYVEARRQADILTALDGLMNIYPRTKMMLVEIKEMPDLLRVAKSESLEPGAYVRLKRPPLYAGDLAQVIDVTENGLEVRLKYVPRLDYGLNEDTNSTQDSKRKRPGGATKPPPRLFSDVEAKKRHIRFLTGNPQTKTWIYKGDEYINGYLEKDTKIQNLITKDVNPTLEEVTRFASGAEDGTENLDLNALAASLKASTANASYLPGDIIEVYEGEQKGVMGKAVSVQAEIVSMAVLEGPLRGQTIEVPVKGLRKRFKEGDHVKVIGGSRFRDEVGMVVRIQEDRVTLLSDQNNSEITVFSKDLREASDTGGSGTLGNFELWDLVQLDPSTVACIVKVDRESLVVLDQNNSPRTVMPSQISNKIDKRRHAVATDRNGSEVRMDDVVKEYGGEGKSGKIMHIYRNYLFCHSRERSEYAGIFVTRTTSVASVSAKGARSNGIAGPDLNQMNPALKRLGGAAPDTSMAPPKSFGRDRAIGQTVTIRKGPYKGLLGIVKETNDFGARVELHTKNKIVNVSREALGFKDRISGQSIDPNGRGGRGGFSGRGGRGGFGGATPGGGFEDGRTPMASGTERTPAWGMRTPAAMANGGRTPAWKSQDGGRTPAWADGSRTVNPHDGSRTSYGAGNRTPAWAAGGKTPAYGGVDSFAAGSKTPAYGGGDVWGSKTPAHQPTGNESYSSGFGGGAWSSNVSSPFDVPTPGASASTLTPAAMNAPTPAPYSAPTPGAMNAPTPAAGWGGWGDSAPTPAAQAAPTPGASGGGYYGAPTPAGYGGLPETPAAWGGVGADDDQPKYVDED